jgi:NAD(P)-dependent dehydrogenase (short-subunit alcohol dehydrogenase family)
MNILVVKSLERLTLHRSYKNSLMSQGNHPLGSKPDNREIAHLQAIEFKRLSQARATLAKTSPQNRLIQPEEAAVLAVFLAQDGSKGINVDGGGVMS